MVKSVEGCIPLAVAAGGVWLEMIARSNTARTCHTLLTRAQDTRPLSNSQYIFIGLIDFSRTPRVVFVKVGRATCAANQSTFTFRLGARDVRFREPVQRMLQVELCYWDAREQGIMCVSKLWVTLSLRFFRTGYKPYSLLNSLSKNIFVKSPF